MRFFTICRKSPAAVACFRRFILSLEGRREETRLSIFSSISSVRLSSAGSEDSGCARDSISAMHTLVPVLDKVQVYFVPQQPKKHELNSWGSILQWLADYGFQWFVIILYFSVSSIGVMLKFFGSKCDY